MAARRFPFSEKVKELFPGKSVEIAGINVNFEPLKFGTLAKALRHLDAMSKELTDAGITFENYNQPMNLARLTSICMETAPEFLQELSNIHTDDLQELPFDEVVNVVGAVIEVNAESFDSLLKNYNSLTEKLVKIPFMAKVQSEKKDLQ